MIFYPKVKYPSIVRGVVFGLTLRAESLDGSELLINSKTYGAFVAPGIYHNGSAFVLNNVPPFIVANKMYGITHLQKYSSHGWLRADPFCFHWWKMSKLQDRDRNGVFIPGTEEGIYFRSPLSWRWQIDPDHPWIFTKGFLGGHFD